MRRLLKFLKRPSTCLWGTVTLLGLYVLSVGPVEWLWWNYRMPQWLTVSVQYFYLPLIWTFDSGDGPLNKAIGSYLMWWHSLGVPPEQPVNTGTEAFPKAPPFFGAVAGTLLGAWLVWNFVRWINQRKEARPA